MATLSKTAILKKEYGFFLRTSFEILQQKNVFAMK